MIRPGSAKTALSRYHREFTQATALLHTHAGSRSILRYLGVFRTYLIIPRERIRDVAEYVGLRLTLTGLLAGSRIPIQADIGFGGVVTPETVVMEYPTLPGGPASRLSPYLREIVIAEKYQPLVAFGMANSRMKDFFDLWAGTGF